MPRTPWGNPEASLKHDYHAVTEERSKRTILTFVFFRALTRSPHIPTDLFSPFESVANVPRPEIFFRQIILVGGGGVKIPPHQNFMHVWQHLERTWQDGLDLW